MPYLSPGDHLHLWVDLIHPWSQGPAPRWAPKSLCESLGEGNETPLEPSHFIRALTASHGRKCSPLAYTPGIQTKGMAVAGGGRKCSLEDPPLLSCQMSPLSPPWVLVSVLGVLIPSPLWAPPWAPGQREERNWEVGWQHLNFPANYKCWEERC